MKHFNRMKHLTEKIYDKHIGINLSWYVFGILSITLLVLSYLYKTGNLDDKFSALIGGLIASMIAVVIQFLLAWNEHREVERLKGMGFLNVLPNRESRKKYYKLLLERANDKIDFLGNTASTFLEDFAYNKVGANEQDRLLLTLLNKRISVRILISPENLIPTQKKEKYNLAKERLDELERDYPDYFKYCCLTEKPTQTFVRVDDACVFGPVFPGIESRVTPAIHAVTLSPFMKQYLEYFETEWETLSKTKKK
jgi:hypothetical protein